MRPEERENDMLEQLLRESLASEAVPSEDFTARLMEKVNRTPQEKRVIAFPYKKVLATVAACAVIAAAIPLALSGGGAPMNDAASADCAVPMESAMQDTNDEVADQEFTGGGAMGGDANDGAAPYLTMQPKENAKPEYETPDTDWAESSTAAMDDADSGVYEIVTLTGDAAQSTLAALADMGIAPTEMEGDSLTYSLTAAQAAELAALEGDYPDGVTLVLMPEDAG